MTYSSGGLIQATDYNGFVSTINAVWNTQWGQTALGVVSTGGTVTAAQWATLASTVTNAYIHQSGSNPSVASPSAGSTIATITNLSTAVTYVATYPYNCYASGTLYTTTSGTNTAGATGSGSASWTLNFYNTVTFSSGTARNNFFGAGGFVRINFNKSSTGQSNDPTWNALAAACNEIRFTGAAAYKTIAGTGYYGTNKSGGSGTPSLVATGIGYDQLTGSNQEIFRQYYTTYPYTSDYIALYALITGNSVQFQAVWFQQAGGAAYKPVNISAGAQTACSYYPPESTYISNTWGTPTISASVS